MHPRQDTDGAVCAVAATLDEHIGQIKAHLDDHVTAKRIDEGTAATLAAMLDHLRHEAANALGGVQLAVLDVFDVLSGEVAA